MANFGRIVNPLDNSNILNRVFNILIVQCGMTAKQILEISSQDFTLREKGGGKFPCVTFSAFYIFPDGKIFVGIFTERIFAGII